VLEANACRYNGKPPEELDSTHKQRQKRAIAEYLAAIGAAGAIEPRTVCTSPAAAARVVMALRSRTALPGS
jgi:hypothetical protein